MKTAFVERLESGEVMIADGATGTNLQEVGLAPGTPAEVWVLDAPERVGALHRAFVAAGSDIILTCSFGGNRFRMKDTAYRERVPDVNRSAAKLAREAADEVDRVVFVAGSMGPTGLLLEPLGSLKRAEVVSAYEQQAAALTEGGVDCLVLETFFALEEAEAAIEGAQRASSLSLVCSFSYDRNVRTMMGVSPSQMAQTIAPLGVAAIGANCGTTPQDMLEVVEALVAQRTGLPIWSKPNAGIPVGDPPRHTVGPADMADFAARCVAAGAGVVGGCCGNTPAHVRAMVERVREI